MLKRLIPARLKRPLRAWRDARRGCRELGVRSLPGRDLRERVHGSPSVSSFLSAGKRCGLDLLQAVDKVGLVAGKRCDANLEVLDFGCGSGRTLLWLRSLRPTWTLWGCDIDADAIAWCRTHVDGDRHRVNGPLPPLPFEANRFDLIYAVSVLTHLDEARGLAWLEELRRVVRPDGIVLLSLHGPSTWRHLDEGGVAREISEHGFAFRPVAAWNRWFPEWYGNAFHTREYVAARFTCGFDLVEHLDRGLAGHHDLIVLRRSDDAAERT